MVLFQINLLIGFIPQIILLIFGIFTLISALTRDPSVKKSKYLLIFSILYLIYYGFAILFVLIPPPFFLFLLLPPVQFSIIVLGLNLFLIYAVMNRDNFDFFLTVAVLLFQIALMLNIFFALLPNYLIVEYGVTLSTIQLIIPTTTAIRHIIFALGSIFLIIHGFKNEDTYMIIAGFVNIAFIGYLWIANVILFIF